MQIDIAQHIEQLLYNHDTLIVPGFGGFTSSKTPASVDYIGGVLTPPSKVLTFNENLTVDDGILVHDIAHTHNITSEEARKVVSAFAEKTTEALNQREIVSLPGIGRLYKNYAQKIQFLPDTTNFNTESFGLPQINLAAASASANSHVSDSHTAVAEAPAIVERSAPTAVVTEPPPPVRNEAADMADDGKNIPPVDEPQVAASPGRFSTSSSWLIPLVLTVATAVGLGLWFGSKSGNKTPLKKDKITINETPPAPVPIPGVGDVVQAPNKDAAVVAIEKETSKDDIGDEVDEYAQKKMAAEKERNASKKAVTSKSSDKKAEETTSASSNPESGNRCVLILATFKDRENVTKLVDKLKANNYDTYHRMEKGHQVGVEFYYKDIREVQQKIKDLQALTGIQNIWIKKK